MLHVWPQEQDVIFILYVCTSNSTPKWTEALEQNVDLQKLLNLEFVYFS